MARIYAFLFPGFREVPGHDPGLPAIVAVSSEPAGVAFSFQGGSLSGFILLYRRPLPLFRINKYITCDCQCLGPMVFTVYVAGVHIYLQISVS